MYIKNIEIGSEHTFVIAEIGNNHNGSFDRAIKMINLAKEMKVDCVKFQMRQLDYVYRQKTLKKQGDDLSTEYILDLLSRFELSIEEHKKLKEYCDEMKIIYMCTPWDEKSVSFLENLDVCAYKVSSADLTNLFLIGILCRTKKPLILSTGMSSIDEIKKTINFLNNKKSIFALLHCNSTYPAPFEDIQLNLIDEIKKIHPLVGYSGHERGINITLAAKAKGACIIERHFTLNRTMEGPDHAASLEFNEFRELVQGIRQIELALRKNDKKKISQGEKINRENLSKSLVSVTKISKGTVINNNHIKVRSPGLGLSPHYLNDLIGKKIKRDMEEEDYFFESDLSKKLIPKLKYKFKRPWGVPVRYHDFSKFSNLVNPDLFEFHLSYSDMDLNPNDFIAKQQNKKFIVHAPELFKGSHLMDLATPDENYRKHSIKETQKIIDITRKLKLLFPKTKKPLIVANIGGISMDNVIIKKDKKNYYKRFKNSLSLLDTDGVEIIPQTMAPFPWHFGGQRFQNLFVEIEEIEEWCLSLSLRMCFDISHSYLTCNHYKFDFTEFVKRISPFTAHIHIGDGFGTNGEGLQIGDGDINFLSIGKILKDKCPDASFIPEIWQGHKNDGEGFWIALQKLEELI